MDLTYYAYQGNRGQSLTETLAEALIDCTNAHGPARLVLVPLAGAGIAAAVPVQPVAYLHYRDKGACWQVGIVTQEGSK